MFDSLYRQAMLVVWKHGNDDAQGHARNSVTINLERFS
jgi:hypothetical protein